jgi:hypothetical protein
MTTTDPCTCAHAAGAHRHYRAGTDCALCDCPRYRRAPVEQTGGTRITCGVYGETAVLRGRGGRVFRRLHDRRHTPPADRRTA